MTTRRLTGAIRAAANLLAITDRRFDLFTSPNELLEQDIAELRGACNFLEQQLGLDRNRMHGIQLETLRGLRERDDG